MEEVKIITATPDLRMHWLPCGVKREPGNKSKLIATTKAKDQFDGQTFQGRQLQGTSVSMSSFSGRVVGIGSFDNLLVYNHDDMVTKADMVPQTFAMLHLQNLLGSLCQ